jgi:copper chaperone
VHTGAICRIWSLAVSTPIDFTLPTMTCGHCVRAVTQAVHSVDPQAVLAVDLPTHRVHIESVQPAAAFAQALVEEGYTPA